MFCKFCGCEMPDDLKVCPDCGQQVKGDNGWKLAVVVLCTVLLAAVLVVAVLFGTGVLGGEKDGAAPAETTTPTEPSVPEQSAPAVDFDSYTAADDVALEKANEVVATLGDMQLTNSELQLHYWYQVYEFLNQNYYYVSMIGMDLAKGLDEQACYFEPTMSWQEYFLQMALDGWKNYAVLYQLAQDNGYQLDDEGKEYMENIRDGIASDAKLYGYESVEKMLLSEAGPGCTIDGFVSYRKLMYVSMQYFNQEYTKMTPTDAEAAEYFEQKAADYEQAGVTKDSGSLSDVRHILIKVTGGTQDESGKTVYSEEEWAACLAEAERVYGLWKDGEATEESFAALVQEHTDDGGSQNTGGLYEGIGENSGYVPEFEAWAIDPARKVGDTGLVKVEASNYAGYHFMYYVGAREIWLSTAADDLLNERFMEFMEKAYEAYPMTTDMEKIVLGNVSLA